MLVIVANLRIGCQIIIVKFGCCYFAINHYLFTAVELLSLRSGLDLEVIKKVSSQELG